MRTSSAKIDAKKAKARKRTDLELELRIQGLSIRAIAEKLGVSKSLVHKNIRAELRAPRPATPRLRKLEEARLDGREQRCNERREWADTMARSLCKVALRDDDGNLIPVDAQAVAAMARVANDAEKLGLAVQKQRAELLGLNAPTKQELSGPDGNALQVAGTAAIFIPVERED